MRRIEKSDIRDLLIAKLNVKEEDYDIVDKIVSELFDQNIKAVFPLTEDETLIFRLRYGINIEKPLRPEYMVNETNLSYTKIRKCLSKVFIKLGFRLNKVEKREKVEKLTTFKEDAKDMLVLNFDVSEIAKNTLLVNNIYSLKELLECDYQKLSEILGRKSLKEVTDFVHSLGYKFYNELSVDSKKDIIMGSDFDTISNSDVSWLSGLNNIDSELITSSNLKNIRDYLIMKKYVPVDGGSFDSDREIDKYSFSELLELPIEKLELNRITNDLLKINGIDTIRKLVLLERIDVSRIPRIGVKRLNEIISKVHNLGLYFKDEMQKAYNYSEEMYNELIEDIKKSK